MEEVEALFESVYKLGKITNKYLIVEIFAYTFDDFKLVCENLHSCSKCMRSLLINNYIQIRNMLLETHLYK
jgi:hypothetical protein